MDVQPSPLPEEITITPKVTSALITFRTEENVESFVHHEREFWREAAEKTRGSDTLDHKRTISSWRL